MSEEQHSIAICITMAQFKRPRNPKRCNIHRYHVWRWKGDPKPPVDLKCQCGLITVPPNQEAK